MTVCDREGRELGEGVAAILRHAAFGREARRLDVLGADGGVPGVRQPVEERSRFPGPDGECR